MERKITVKGVGRAVVQPDYVEISIELRAMHKTYEKAMAKGNNQILNLTSYVNVPPPIEAEASCFSENSTTNSEELWRLTLSPQA